MLFVVWYVFWINTHAHIVGHCLFNRNMCVCLLYECVVSQYILCLILSVSQLTNTVYVAWSAELTNS